MKTCKCNDIFKTGVFRSYGEFTLCDKSIRLAIQESIVESIKEPDWAYSAKNELGGAGFFKCKLDNSIYKLLLPEKAQRGYWKKISEDDRKTKT